MQPGGPNITALRCVLPRYVCAAGSIAPQYASTSTMRPLRPSAASRILLSNSGATARASRRKNDWGRRRWAFMRGVGRENRGQGTLSRSRRAFTSMRVFVLRARSAPTDSRLLLDAVGKEAHTEILAHTLMNAIFVAQSHRADVVMHLVMKSSPDFSRTIRFDANAMHDIGGFHEQALLAKIATALDVSRGMGKEESRAVEPGITVRTISFEKLVQELARDYRLFVMDRKG